MVTFDPTLTEPSAEERLIRNQLSRAQDKIMRQKKKIKQLEREIERMKADGGVQ